MRTRKESDTQDLVCASGEFKAFHFQGHAANERTIADLERASTRQVEKEKPQFVISSSGVIERAAGTRITPYFDPKAETIATIEWIRQKAVSAEIARKSMMHC